MNQQIIEDIHTLLKLEPYVRFNNKHQEIIYSQLANIEKKKILM